MGTRRIDLVGRGEPLLNRSALDIIRYVKGRGVYLVLCTNASRLFEPIAREFVALGSTASIYLSTPERRRRIRIFT